MMTDNGIDIMDDVVGDDWHEEYVFTCLNGHEFRTVAGTG